MSIVRVHVYAVVWRDEHPRRRQWWLRSATANGTLSSDPLLDSWECVRTGLLVPVGTTLLYAEIAAVEDVQNDDGAPELAGHFADEAALWFSVDP